MVIKRSLIEDNNKFVNAEEFKILAEHTVNQLEKMVDDNLDIIKIFEIETDTEPQISICDEEGNPVDMTYDDLPDNVKAEIDQIKKTIKKPENEICNIHREYLHEACNDLLQIFEEKEFYELCSRLVKLQNRTTL